VKKNGLLFWIAILTALWFASAGMVWFYMAALFIAYPVGLVSLLIWARLSDKKHPKQKIIIKILSVGLILSMSALICMLIFK
jgi:MFS family permease